MKINKDKVLFTLLGEEGVIFDTENNKYFTLNETSVRILRGFEDGKDEEAIVKDFLDEYDIAEETCKNEVQETIKLLVSKGYLY